MFGSGFALFCETSVSTEFCSVRIFIDYTRLTGLDKISGNCFVVFNCSPFSNIRLC